MRQQDMLTQARDCLVRATAAEAEEMVAEELRAATAALGRLLGRVDVEDVLDRIFGEFCIGK
jgi:tRNA modification GTPase